MVRAQLEEILASDTFSRSERLRRFLRFIVDQALNGQAACLKEQVLASELYGRSTDFEAATDPVVRVDARRLRDKLREYYDGYNDKPVVITLPRGGYVAFPRARCIFSSSAGGFEAEGDRHGCARCRFRHGPRQPQLPSSP
jgi:hypothetical protein